MNTTYPEMIAAGLLVVRLVVGTLMMGHATQKLFGWLGATGSAAPGGSSSSSASAPGWCSPPRPRSAS
jgi:putative oxidoreductase